MTTTTIRIDPSLKERVAAAAQRTGKTAHAFIIDAVAQTVEQIEAEDELHRLVDQRWAKLLESGNSVPWNEAREYLIARTRGEAPAKPAARKPRP